MKDTALTFKVEAPFAHFRRIDGNAVRQTYSCPTRTAIEGFLGAIMGYSRDEYYKDLSPENIQIGLEIENDIRKMQIPQTFLKTEGENTTETDNGIKTVDPNTTDEGRQRFNVQYLRDVEYNIYLIIKNSNILKDLKNRLKTNNFVYSPYLGTTECIVSNIKFISEDKVENKEVQKEKVSSIVPKEYANLHPKENMWYKIERMPYHFEKKGNGRRPQGYKNYYISKNNLTVSSSLCKIINGKKIIPM